MKFDKNQLLLYAVTDRAWTGKQSLTEQVEAALRGGVTCVQLREKELDEDTFLKEAREIAVLCRRYRVPLIINDNPWIAAACGADGVHVGQGDLTVREARAIAGEQMIVGVSAHSVEEALAAQREGADYLGAGAMFLTSTKSDASPLSKDTLRAICQSVSIPVVAIGGIQKSNIRSLAGCKAAGAALVSAIFGAEDIETACRELAILARQMRDEETGMKTALSIAGSDCSGGAGIQADLKTMMANGVYGMSAVTALTAQNTLGVSRIEAVSPSLLASQLDAVFTDIRPDGVKIGMIPSRELMETAARRLLFYRAEHIVIDPVMAATAGSSLMDAGALETLKERLLPLAQVITPNIPEAEVLSDSRIESREDMLRAAALLSRRYGCAVLLKGGHADFPGQKDSGQTCDDLLFSEETPQWFLARRLSNPNTHGTGCTLSSAITANLAKGLDLAEAVRGAKEYLSGAIEAGLDLGHGRGPLNHGYSLRTEH